MVAPDDDLSGAEYIIVGEIVAPDKRLVLVVEIWRVNKRELMAGSSRCDG